MQRVFPFTKSALNALWKSATESAALGDGYIGTEHLLLGILGEDSVASAVLTKSKITRGEAAKFIAGLKTNK
jgi:ATP-dependent Clp protease ATP-binding subunit ClpA